ncbi:MAG: hypothetical protein OEZ34_03645 [Spirochaetia bacterium]|nr:hypothetical protein [Spirochaetia bacterium]
MTEKFLHYNEELLRICEDTQNRLNNNRSKRSTWQERTLAWKKQWLKIDPHSPSK